jgi:hypothetical protein
MPESTSISASQLFSDDASEFFIDAGVPRYNRRLTDKILAAFNHAYAMGEVDLARALWDCLVTAERGGQHMLRRRPNQALDLAAEWVAFVDARDRYREASRKPRANADEASRAFRTMRDAYQSWKAHNASDNASPLRPTAAAAGEVDLPGSAPASFPPFAARHG